MCKALPIVLHLQSLYMCVFVVVSIFKNRGVKITLNVGLCLCKITLVRCISSHIDEYGIFLIGNKCHCTTNFVYAFIMRVVNIFVDWNGYENGANRECNCKIYLCICVSCATYDCDNCTEHGTHLANYKIQSIQFLIMCLCVCAIFFFFPSASSFFCCCSFFLFSMLLSRIDFPVT